jgi:hypothetical protein
MFEKLIKQIRLNISWEMAKLKLKFKIGALALAISLISVVIVIIYLLRRSPATPDFLVDGAAGELRQYGVGYAKVSYYLLTFNITNNGTAASVNVNGNASYQEYGRLYNATWHWFNITQKDLAVGQKSRAYAQFWDVPSETKQFSVIVSCAEKVEREFNITVS